MIFPSETIVVKYEVAAGTEYDEQNLLEFPQTIPLSAVVKVVFELR